MKAMKAMKAMRATKAMKGGGLTQTGIFQSVAETTGLKTKDVKGTVEAIMGVAAEELKKNGKFKLAGMMNLKLKKKVATAARKGINPFTKEPCVFKAKPASKTVKIYAMKKLKESVN
jgi:nucleoid DNA-binding protein